MHIHNVETDVLTWINTANLLHQVQPRLLAHVGPRAVRREEDQQVSPLRPVVADGPAQHAVRPELLPHPQRGRRRHQRLLRGRRRQQAVGRRQLQRAQGVLRRPAAVDADLAERDRRRHDGAQREDVEAGEVLMMLGHGLDIRLVFVFLAASAAVTCRSSICVLASLTPVVLSLHSR